MTVLQHLNTKIDSGSFIEVEKITPVLIKEAISKLKNDTTDLFHFNSDCMKNVPAILCELSAKLFRMYLIRGYISSIIMVSTVIPLIKDKLGDISLSIDQLLSPVLYSKFLIGLYCYFMVPNSVRMSSNLATNKRPQRTCAHG